MTALEGVKAGDEIYVSGSWGSASGRIVLVEHITPTGRVVTKHISFNKNGRQIGGSTYSRHYASFPVTDEQHKHIRRRDLVSLLERQAWTKVDDDKLEAVAAVLSKEQQQ